MTPLNGQRDPKAKVQIQCVFRLFFPYPLCRHPLCTLPRYGASSRGLSGPSGPNVLESVPESVPENGGDRGSVPGNGVSKKCRRSVKKVSWKLRGHSRDIFWTPGHPPCTRVKWVPFVLLAFFPPFYSICCFKIGHFPFKNVVFWELDKTISGPKRTNGEFGVPNHLKCL